MENYIVIRLIKLILKNAYVHAHEENDYYVQSEYRQYTRIYFNFYMNNTTFDALWKIRNLLALKYNLKDYPLVKEYLRCFSDLDFYDYCKEKKLRIYTDTWTNQNCVDFTCVYDDIIYYKFANVLLK